MQSVNCGQKRDRAGRVLAGEMVSSGLFKGLLSAERAQGEAGNVQKRLATGNIHFHTQM